MGEDLFEVLRAPAPVDPLPAVEVRQRGDRLRRRRAAVQVLGVAALVVVVTAGAVSVADRLRDDAAPPAHQPKPSPTATAHRIPDGAGRLTASALLTAADLTVAMKEHPAGVHAQIAPQWQVGPPFREMLAFGCGDQVPGLGSVTARLARAFEARAAQARTMVVEIPGENGAADAFDRLARALDRCTGPAPMTPRGPVQGTDGGENASAWRGFTSSAPARLVGEGVVKIGTRLALVRVSVAGAQAADPTAPWLEAVLQRAGDRLAGAQ